MDIEQINKLLDKLEHEYHFYDAKFRITEDALDAINYLDLALRTKNVHAAIRKQKYALELIEDE